MDYTHSTPSPVITTQTSYNSSVTTNDTTTEITNILEDYVNPFDLPYVRVVFVAMYLVVLTTCLVGRLWCCCICEKVQLYF